jgi:ABC-type transport system involved in multi-copper enzyme maturation permease subunit
MSWPAIRTVAEFAIKESLRRRVFIVVGVLTLVFLALYGAGAEWTFDEVDEFGSFVPGVDERTATGATLLGLAMFATLFLGTVLGVFLTLGAVRGDAESGMLQPIVVRPLSRRDLLAGRFLAAAGVCSAYVIAVFLVTALLTKLTGGWWPDRFVAPALQLALGVCIIAAISLAGSVVLSATANGIAIFMVFGAGLVAGLLGQIGEGLNSETLGSVSNVATWILPFEALYQDALSGITADTSGLTKFALQLGPFGGAEDAGAGLWLYAVAYLAAVGAAATAGFARRDL